VLFGLVVVGLIGILAFAAGRETAATSAQASARRALPTPRPALTSAEQAYLQALWPIHADVERSTMRITLAQIFYKIDDLDRPQLRTRIDEALATYRRAEARLRELQPPSSLRSAHDDYLVAVGLFDDSAVELLKMFDDGSEDHFMAAYPLSLEGSNRIREIGGRFWPDEYPPN
jgi:hypothetical protein